MVATQTDELSHAPLRRYHDLWPVREHQNIKNLDDLVGSLTIAPISTAHGIITNP